MVAYLAFFNEKKRERKRKKKKKKKRERKAIRAWKAETWDRQAVCIAWPCLMTIACKWKLFAGVAFSFLFFAFFFFFAPVGVADWTRALA